MNMVFGLMDQVKTIDFTDIMNEYGPQEFANQSFGVILHETVHTQESPIKIMKSHSTPDNPYVWQGKMLD